MDIETTFANSYIIQIVVMKQRKITTCLLALWANFLIAQNHPCALDLMKPNQPLMWEAQHILDDAAAKHFKSGGAADFSNEAVTIPVVVHIIHNNGTENISDAQVEQAIQWLNESFANQGYFDQNSGAETGIQFCLAKQKPDGTATNGIVRVQSALYTEIDIGSEDLELKNLSRWNPSKYINIWVIKEACYQGNCGVAGYAYPPTYHGNSYDGLVVESKFFGTDPWKIALATHEMGHYFGLLHTFEGGCINADCLVNGDKVCDTPPDNSTAYIDCSAQANTCNTDTQSGFSTDQQDLTNNYLDYNNLLCTHDFTEGQAKRMEFFLNGTRQSLLGSNGCDLPCPLTVNAAFTPSDLVVELGATVSFTNTSQNASTYTWKVNGQQFSTNPNPTYQFNQVGTFTILLAAESNNALCDVDLFSKNIIVNCNTMADFTVSALTAALGETITINNTSTNATQYEWFVNGASQGSSLNTYTLMAEGIYYIRLVATNGSCSDEKIIIVEVPGICTDFAFQISLVESTISSMTILKDSTIMLGLLNTSGNKNLMKVNKKGEVVYVKKVVSTSSTEPIRPTRLEACDDGGFISTFEYTPGYNTIAKFNTEADPIWALSFFSGQSPSDAVSAPNGGAYVLINDPTLDLYQNLVRISGTGTIMWKVGIGSNLPLVVQRIHPANDGSVYLTGSYNNSLSFIMKIDQNGEFIWKKSILSSGLGFYANTMSEDNEGSVYLADEQNAVLKLSPTGNKVWAKQFLGIEGIISISGSATGSGFTMVGAVLTPLGYIDGVVGISSNGDIIWASLPLTNIVHTYEIKPYFNSGYIITGINGTFDNNQGCLLKTNAIGGAGACYESILLSQSENISVFASIGQFSISDLDIGTASSSTLISFDRTQDLIPLCDVSCISAELCFNNLDDDGDGLADCLDSDCICDDFPCENRADENWYFGTHAGLNFSTSPPTVLTDGQTITSEATSTISDAQGNLLFYFGDRGRNRFHDESFFYVQGGGWLDEWQIVPHPTKKYLFYAFKQSQIGGVHYSLIDMRLYGGKGYSVPGFENILLTSPSTAIANSSVIESCDFDGYWLVANDDNGSNFWAYKIDANGPQATPVISNTLDSSQEMACSPDGTTIAFVKGSKLSLYAFDKSTGAIQFESEYIFPTNPLQIFEFSPNGKLLYLRQKNQNPVKILQVDLTSSDSSAVINSAIEMPEIAVTTGKGYLAPDNKIYFSRWTTNGESKLGTIHRPNIKGQGCLFEPDAMSLGDSTFVKSLCNTIRRNNAPIEAYIKRPAPDTICISEPATDYTYFARNIGCSTDSVDWKIEGLDAVFVQKDNKQATLNFLGGGSGRLILTVFTACNTSADTIPIFITKSSEKVLDLGDDISICELNAVNLKAESGFTKYKWNNGSTDSTIITLVPGKYWIDVWDDCGNKQTDTINVVLNPISSIGLGADIETCKNTTTTFQRPDDIIAWNWSPVQGIPCDTCQTITLSPTQTTTWEVTGANQYGCVTKDFLKITVVNTISIVIDTSICVKDQITLYGNEFPSDTMASVFLPTDGSGCDTLLMVTVSPKKAEIAIAPTEKTIKIGDAVEIKTTLSGAAPFNLAWTPATYLTCTDCLDPISEPLENITYLLSVTDKEGCVTEDSVKITVVDSCTLYIPNIFSPNGDKINDIFYPITDPCVKIVYSWRIINRWGDLIFESVNFEPNNPDFGWNGLSKGRELPTDTYVWVAEWGYYDGRKEVRKGDVTLVR